MKNKKLWMVILTLAMAFSVAISATMATSAEEAPVTGTVDYVAQAGELLKLTQGASVGTDGTIDMVPSGNPRVTTKAVIENLSSFEFTIGYTDMPSTDWVTFVMFMDTAPGKSTWERGDASETAYCVNISYTVLSLQRGVGNSFGPAGDNSEYTIANSAEFFATEHTFKVNVNPTLAGTYLTLYLDGVKIINTVDVSANKLSNDGNITFVTHCDTGLSANLTKFTATNEAAAPASELTANVEENFELTQGATADAGVITMPSNSISRVATKNVLEEMSAIEVTMDINIEKEKGQWIAQFFFMDNAPGKTSWERGGDEKAYIVDFSPNVIAIKRIIGNSQAAITNCEYAITEAFYDTVHTYEFVVKTSIAKTEITMYVDGKAVITAYDDGATKITEDGYVTIANHNAAAAQITIYDFTVKSSAGEEEDTRLFDEAALQNSFADLATNNATVDTENSTATLNNSGLASIYTKSAYRNVKLCLAMTLNVTEMTVGYNDWYAMLAISDQTPNTPVWVGTPVPAGERYIFYFDAEKISLRYYNASAYEELASYTLPESFYDVEHTYNITLAATSAGVQIMMNIDQAEIEFNVSDTADTKILKAGAIYLLTQGDNKIGATVTKFKTSAAEEVQEELTTDFDFDAVETQLDFSDLVDRENWTGSMNEPVFAGQTVFYKGGTKDNIYMGGPGLKTVGTWPGEIVYTDFVLTFKATITWPEDAGDWGGILTFRDTEPGLPTWEGNLENNRVAYGVKWDVDSQNSDVTTNGVIAIMRWNGAGGGVGLCQTRNLHLSGKEITYKLACVNGTDEKGAYVRVVLLADGKVVADAKDYGENNEPNGSADWVKPNITTGGGFMLMNHYTRTFHIKGVNAGEAAEEIVIGANQGNQGGDEPTDSTDTAVSNSGYGDGDDETPINSNEGTALCGSSMTASSMAFGVIALASAVIASMRKKRK